MTDITTADIDEQIIKVREFRRGREIVFYAIRDMYLGCWRSVHPLEDEAAWTWSRRQRARFRSHAHAMRELEVIWRWRYERASQVSIPSVREAA